MWTLEQKQRYLQEHISEEWREDFWGYIDEEVGNYDIEKWTDSFIIKLVDKFNTEKHQQSNMHETSFYQYQAEQKPQSPRAQNNSILSAINQQEEPSETTKEAIEVAKEKEAKGQSAFALLDSIFKKKGQTQKNIEQPNPQHFKTRTPVLKKEPKQDKLDVNAFATNQFWDVGGKSNKVISKPKADFADFDFWSQPSSSAKNSPVTTKQVTADAFAKKPSPKQEDTKSVLVIPTFDELISKNKAQSPYLKKTNPDDVIYEKPSPALPPKQKVEKSLDHPKTSEKTIVKQVSRSLDKPKTKSSMKSSQISKTKVLYEGDVIIKHQFQTSVKCFQATQRARLKTPDLKIVFDGHQIISRTFLMPDYAMYKLKIVPLDIVIKRNYQDFSRLRTTLAKLFPGTKLAHLPKGSWFSSTNQEYIKKQKIDLQFFMNDLIKNPEVRNSRILQDFLTLLEHKKIKRKFEQWQKLQAPKSIEQLCWLQGRVNVNLSQQQRLYHQNLKRYNGKMVLFLQKQQRLTDSLLSQYRDIDYTQKQLVGLVKDMINETIYFNERVYGLQLEKALEAFNMLHNCFVQQNKFTKFKIDTIEDLIGPFAKYEKQNITELNQLIDTQQQFFKVYLKRSTLQKIDTATPYNSDKLKAFKTGVLQPSKNIVVLKHQTAFLSNQLCFQGQRVLETLGQKYLALYKDYSQRCRWQCLDMLEFWSADNYVISQIKT